MEQLSLIRKPIETELSKYKQLFDSSLQSSTPMLTDVLSHIRNRRGKMMRPILVLLAARNWGRVTDGSYESAVSLELLHTASLVHDDIVDESDERRGQPSVNAVYNNKVAVLVGDYMLSTSLLHAANTLDSRVVRTVSDLGIALSSGEILQLSNVQNPDFSYDVYYDIIRHKTAALFAACSKIGAITSGASDDDVEKARLFGETVGICFQIRDDIFDYFDDSNIGKPTGNDMREGKLTLPVLYALNSTGNAEIQAIARRVKQHDVTADEVARLVEFTKQNGGIEYAEKMMEEFRQKALELLSDSPEGEIKDALLAYIEYVVKRNM